MKRCFAALVLLMSACEDPVTPSGGTPDAPTSTGGATFTALYNGYFQNCKTCHTPSGPSRTDDIEMTLDFTTQSTAYASIKNGMATNLMGNFQGCNGVPFVQPSPMNSLIVAVVDEDTRMAYDLVGHPNCDMDSISDETVKVGSAPTPAFVASLQAWIAAGAPNN